MTMLNITGLGGQFDGRYEMVVPTTTEQKLFRRAAEIDPAEMTQILANGAIESFALLIFAAIRRAGKTTDGVTDGLVDKLLDLPMDVLTGAVDDSQDGDGNVPPASAHGEPG